MKANIISWNMAGAKVFGKLDGPDKPAADTYTQHFQDVWKDKVKPYIHMHTNPPQDPDILLLQECIGFIDHRKNPSGRWYEGERILQQIYRGYECFFFPAFSSRTHPNPARWNQFREGGGIGHFIPYEIEAQQGYGVCVREGLLRRLWLGEAELSENQPDADLPQGQYDLCFQAIHTTTGLYLGSRDTEPRLAVLGRVKSTDGNGDIRYVNFVNIHLTTLKGEREGNIRVDRIGSTARLRQLDLILDNVISAYQVATYRAAKSTPTRKEDVWIVAGDLNAIQASREVELLTQVGFVDGTPDKRLWDETGQFHDQIGTKWSVTNLSAPPIVVDYIFCGLQATAFPVSGLGTRNSPRPYRPAFPPQSPYEPDHALLFVSFEIL